MSKSLVSALLPLPKGLRLTAISEIADGLLVCVSSTRPSAACPLCSTLSHHVHSHYSRSPADLPCAGRPIRRQCQNWQHAASSWRIWTEPASDTQLAMLPTGRLAGHQIAAGISVAVRVRILSALVGCGIGSSPFARHTPGKISTPSQSSQSHASGSSVV
jgi:hypothetical protein